MNQLKSQKETIVYGGAFNPPTKAHHSILQTCVDYAEARRADVWLLPSGNRTDKEINTPRETRLRMLEALSTDIVARSVGLGIETSELDRIGSTETVDTVYEMNEKYPGRTFTWVFGADSVATMPEWKEGEWLIDNLSMLVIRRPGTTIEALGKNAAVLEIADMPYSSTEVRERMAAGRSVDDLVTPSVARLLAEAI